MQSKKNYFKQLKALLPKALANITHIKVAAIIVTDKGIFKGVNYEDPVLALSICAERAAIISAIPYGMKKIYEIHVLSSVSKTTKLHMCGACRQVASGFSDKKTKAFIYSHDGDVKTYQLSNYLPFANNDINKQIIKGKIRR